MKNIKNYWLVKSEPSSWSWQEQKNVKKEMWDGVRNYQARNNLMKMKKGDLCFLYHSVKEKKILGVVKVVREHYPDPTDKSGKFVVVDFAFYKELKNSVSLDQIKKEKKLENLSLIKQSRLSVMPVDRRSWNLILKLSNN